MTEELHTVPTGKDPKGYAIIGIDPDNRTVRWIEPTEGKSLYTTRQGAHRRRVQLEGYMKEYKVIEKDGQFAVAEFFGFYPSEQEFVEKELSIAARRAEQEKLPVEKRRPIRPINNVQRALAGQEILQEIDHGKLYTSRAVAEQRIEELLHPSIVDENHEDHKEEDMSKQNLEAEYQERERLEQKFTQDWGGDESWSASNMTYSEYLQKRKEYDLYCGQCQSDSGCKHGVPRSRP